MWAKEDNLTCLVGLIKAYIIINHNINYNNHKQQTKCCLTVSDNSSQLKRIFFLNL